MNDKLTMTNPLGELIKSSLSKKGWSAEKLARNINYNGGTIRQIISGQRVPKYKTLILEKIARELDISLEDMERVHSQALKEKEEKGKGKRSGKSFNTINEITEPLKKLDDINPSYSENFCTMKEPCGAIRGTQNLIKTKISMLKALLKDEKIPDNNKIYIIFMGKDSILDSHKELGKEYQNLLAKVIAKGWDVIHIMRLDSNHIEELMKLCLTPLDFLMRRGNINHNIFSIVNLFYNRPTEYF